MSSRANDKPVLCVGRLYCDLIFAGVPRMPSLGTEIFANDLGFHPGGGAFITASHLVRLGRPAALAAMVSAPPFGAALEPMLAASGVDTTLCRRLPDGTPPQLTAAVLGDDDRAFVTYRSGPACPPLDIDELKRLGAAHLHIGELTTLVERPDLIERARAAGMSISLDCAWDETLDPETLSALIAKVDVFLPNTAEVDWLGDAGVALPEDVLLVIKCGRAGARAVAQGASFSAPAQKVGVVDTTGAGDAFNAGFLDAWLAGRPVQDCLVAGNAQGAVAVQQPGGCAAMPDTPAPPVSELVK